MSTDRTEEARHGVRALALALAFVAAAVFALPAAGGETKTAAAGDLDQARAFVRNLQLDENFGGMIVRTALLTPTIRALAKNHEEISVYHALRQFTLVAVSQYGEAWTENLAKAYAAHFSNAEMASIIAERAKSPHFEKIGERGTAVGDTMRDLSYDLLGKAASEVVTKVLREFSGPKR